MSSRPNHLGLALKATRHNAAANALNALTLAAVLAPLLVLFGLRTGIVEGMVARLKSDPAILRVGVAGNRPLTETDIGGLRADPNVGFLVGAPRSLATEVNMRRSDQSDYERVSWIPSAAGDPLLPGRILGPREVAISEPLAERLHIAAGERVLGEAYRDRTGQALTIELTVVAILPRAALAGMRALVPAERLNEVAAFADGYALADYDITGKPLSGRAALYDSLRLYAASLEGVAPLERTVSALGFRTDSAAAQILWVEELERVMTGVFAIISVAGGLSYALTLWATASTNVRQLRPYLAMMRLLGVTTAAIWAVPVVQIAAVTTGGLAIALAVALTVAAAINATFLTEAFSSGVCTVLPAHVAASALAALVVGSLVAATQLRRLGRIEPAEALQEGLA